MWKQDESFDLIEKGEIKKKVIVVTPQKEVTSEIQ